MSNIEAIRTKWRDGQSSRQRCQETIGSDPLMGFLPHLEKLSHKVRLPVCFPETVVYEHHFPRVWYWFEQPHQGSAAASGQEGDDEMRTAQGYVLRSVRSKNCETAAIDESLCRDAGCPVVAQVVTRVHDADSVAIEYLDAAGLRAFLRNVPDHCLLSRFVPPKGKRNEVFVATWTPKRTLIARWQNTRDLRDASVPLRDRARVDDPACARQIFCPQPVETLVSQAVASLVREVEASEKRRVVEFEAHFKIDARSHLWLLFAPRLLLIRPVAVPAVLSGTGKLSPGDSVVLRHLGLAALENRHVDPRKRGNSPPPPHQRGSAAAPDPSAASPNLRKRAKPRQTRVQPYPLARLLRKPLKTNRGFSGWPTFCELPTYPDDDSCRPDAAPHPAVSVAAARADESEAVGGGFAGPDDCVVYSNGSGGPPQPPTEGYGRGGNPGAFTSRGLRGLARGARAVKLEEVVEGGVAAPPPSECGSGGGGEAAKPRAKGSRGEGRTGHFCPRRARAAGPSHFYAKARHAFGCAAAAHKGASPAAAAGAGYLHLARSLGIPLSLWHHRSAAPGEPAELATGHSSPPEGTFRAATEDQDPLSPHSSLAENATLPCGQHSEAAEVLAEVEYAIYSLLLSAPATTSFRFSVPAVFPPLSADVQAVELVSSSADFREYVIDGTGSRLPPMLVIKQAFQRVKTDILATMQIHYGDSPP
ncbi:hypothetical protein DIPPA_17965 [Diplonema papillatum]|nr:hypothetical protein DIPPA_17965 [Diplonema papillatum]